MQHGGIQKAFSACHLSNRPALEGHYSRARPQRARPPKTHACVSNHLEHIRPHLSLNDEMEKVDGLIRKAFRDALHLLPNASTAGRGKRACNTAAEPMEGHHTGQGNQSPGALLRRQKPPRKTWISPAHGHVLVCSVKSSIRNHILIRPIPKNVHPSFHTKTRAHQAMALARKFRPFRAIF